MKKQFSKQGNAAHSHFHIGQLVGKDAAP